MAFANGSNDAYSQMIEVEPGIWAIPGVAFHYLRANRKYFERTGKHFRSTEGFRRIGNPGDYDETPNTQWFYWERKIAKPSSPAGAYPGGSIHGWGRAFDIDLDDRTLDYDVMRACLEEEGFFFDIEGERWHCNYYAADMWTVYDLSALSTTPISPEKSKDPFAEENDMYVWTNTDYDKSYSVTLGSAQHHADDLTKAIALKSIGGNDREIKLQDGELAFALGSMGLGMYVDSDMHLTRFSDPHWTGRQFLAPWQDGGAFFAEFREYHKI